jgi:acyl CoA:acetate/3-ketoacid CoA transferase beta subunit
MSSRLIISRSGRAAKVPLCRGSVTILTERIVVRDFEVTAPGCVDTVVTDLALLRRTDGQFRLEEIARGFTPGEVVALTSMPVDVTGEIGIMQESWGG